MSRDHSSIVPVDLVVLFFPSGAMLVEGGDIVFMSESAFTENSADTGGRSVLVIG